MDRKTSTSIHAAIAGLQRLVEVFQQRRAQLAHSVGVSDQQWAVLEQISTEHFMPSMFARTRESSTAAVSKILRQLTDKGLVSASVDPTDARQRRYELTALGKKTMAALRHNREMAIQATWMALPLQEVENFTRFAARLTESIEKYGNTRSS